YDTAFYIERIGEVLPDELTMPDVHLYFYDTFIVFDHLLQTVTIASVDIFQQERTVEEMNKSIDIIEKQIKCGLTFQKEESISDEFKPTITKERFIQLVKKAKEHISRGDIFQVVLSQRFQTSFSGDPFALYRKLRTSNPSPYMF